MAGGYKGGPEDILLSQSDLPLPVELSDGDITFHKSDTKLTLADNTPGTAVSQSFVASSFEKLVIIRFSGTARALWTLELNGSVIEEFRTEARNGLWDWRGASFVLTAGDLVAVKVEHFRNGQFEDFRATIYGKATA